MPQTPNICAGPFGAVYDLYVERPWLMQIVGRLTWGIDARCLYESIQEVSRLSPGQRVIDVPCGGGVAFRQLRAGQRVEYLAGDLSVRMRARALRRARALGLDQIEVVEADMTALPFADASADLFLSYSGLHMIHEPDLALREIRRCIKPGGRVIGTTFLRGERRRADMLFELGSRRGHAQPPTREALRTGLEQAGLGDVTIGPERGFTAFSARR